MTAKASKVIAALQGKTLATAESCTGGMIGSMLTAVSGASQVYRGGIISYVNGVKQQLLGVDAQLLEAEKKLDREALIGRALENIEKIKVSYHDDPLL